MHAKRTSFEITRNELDADMLNIVTKHKSIVGDRVLTTLWAVVHEDFLADDVYLKSELKLNGSVDVTLTITYDRKDVKDV
jgi:hypothetical protein